MTNQLTTTFLGHQSWAVSSNKSHVLIDPVLTSSFGYRDDLQFAIFPRRVVIHEEMPRPDAVVLTNEHLDHFHLPSLAMLSRATPIIIGAITPAVVSDALHEWGFRKIIRLASGDRHSAGDINVQLIAVSEISPKWEHRVHSAYLSTEVDPGVLIQSDGAFAYGEIERLAVRPRILIVTNNAQIPVNPTNSAFANLLSNNAPATMEGLRLVQAVIDDPASRLRSVDTVLLSGAGYTYDHSDVPLFRWNCQKDLAAAVSNLSLGVKVVGLLPGESLRTDHTVKSVDWVQPTDEVPGNSQRWSEVPRPRHINAGEVLADQSIDLVLEQLQWIEPLLINSALGFAMVGANEFLGKIIGPVRLYLHLRGSSDDYAAVEFDMTTSQFRRSEMSLREAMFSVPFGIDVYIDDFLDVLCGRRQIWELCTASIAQWYDSERSESPVAFLYEVLSEQIRPDLAARLIRVGMLAHA